MNYDAEINELKGKIAALEVEIQKPLNRDEVIRIVADGMACASVESTIVNFR